MKWNHFNIPNFSRRPGDGKKRSENFWNLLKFSQIPIWLMKILQTEKTQQIIVEWEARLLHMIVNERGDEEKVFDEVIKTKFPCRKIVNQTNPFLNWHFATRSTPIYFHHSKIYCSHDCDKLRSRNPTISIIDSVRRIICFRNKSIHRFR